MAHDEWVDIGAAAEFSRQPVQQVMLGRVRVAVSYRDGRFGAISGVCNHVGGPLGQGRLDGDYVVCPWHYWKFHFQTGKGEPGFEEDAVPAYEVREENARVLLRPIPVSKRTRKLHAPHPLARPVVANSGAIRVLGISTTSMTQGQERYSTSDDLLKSALAHAASSLGCESQLVRLHDLKFRPCEGFYSKSARACTWPCSITQMDPEDQLDRVYEGLVHWADVILVATPIRWGAASSLYFKMVERMNCIQNQETIAGRSLLRNKVAGFIITGGQDNVQAVAGQMLGFFAEIGCQYPQYPYIAHSRGWSAEDMENNTRYVQDSKLLHEGAGALAGRCVEMAGILRAGSLKDEMREEPRARGGRKAQELDTHAQLQGRGADPAPGGE
ncbi:MAG: (2Fe-2S)-binding protein [Betaproteobacteria bacterium RIFCSPLOWO2_02_FULL_62_17]|nr:MAG: (2Fe-2S)-binding protein [Betaproteobacteria bacterium RIFCSPLOWO2_02_FULL_62_17]